MHLKNGQAGVHPTNARLSILIYFAFPVLLSPLVRFFDILPLFQTGEAMGHNVWQEYSEAPHTYLPEKSKYMEK